MNSLRIEEIVEDWSDAERHAFWDTVAFKVCEERMTADDAMISTFDLMSYLEETTHEYHHG